MARPGIARMLIVRLGAMGDVIHGLHAAAALREAFPETLLGWLIEERWAELLCTLPTPRSGPRSAQRPLVDRVHTVNTRQWRRAPFSAATWERVAASLSDLRAAHYEIAMDLQGAVRSSLLARWSGAPVIYGAAQPRENLATMFYTRQIIAGGEHIVEQNHVTRRSGCPPAPEDAAGPASTRPCGRAGMRPAAQSERHAGVRTAQPGRWLGSEAMARRTLRAGGKTTVARWFEIAHQLRSRRKRSRARSGSRQRRRSRNLHAVRSPS